MGWRSGRVAGPHHMVAGSVGGYFVCSCGCGYVGACFHCLSSFQGRVQQFYCRAERERLCLGEYAPRPVQVSERGGAT